MASKPCDNGHCKGDFERKTFLGNTRYVCKHCGTVVRPLTYQVYGNTRGGK